MTRIALRGSSVAPQDIAFALPAGADDLTAPPLTTADAEAVTALARADERAVLAEPMTELIDVLGE
uniref:hypothetical protein n=1 Tax=Raoultella terrigena TaxID=577 RepID=UPI0013305173